MIRAAMGEHRHQSPVAAVARARGWMERARLSSQYSRRGIDAVNERLLTAYRVEAILRHYGAHVGHDVVVHGPLVLHNAATDYSNLTIGDHAHVGRLAILDLAGRIEVARHATVSMGVTILTHTDVGASPLRERLPREVADTTIGEASYIGASATILPGCAVGPRAIVAAGAVVHRSIEAGATVGGVPARPLD